MSSLIVKSDIKTNSETVTLSNIWCTSLENHQAIPFWCDRGEVVNLIFYTLSMLVKNENKKCSDYKVGEEVTLQPLSPVKIVFAQKKI